MQWNTPPATRLDLAEYAALPAPAAVVAAYPPAYFWEPPATFPALYVEAAADDTLAPIDRADLLVEGLEHLGISVEYNRVETGGHGFGTGTGTPAEGWIDDAISFWETARADDGSAG
ncbi:hypothetical protein [Microbacterium telephonicum]|uniref:hypothetical protein n=1 Tax=Microbacterium telephonicum TaxID=1714841 RepID=UPI000EB09834|nr:hypothetical protein [Microbacterium telephonicum]